MKRLQGKRALITGAARGIGLAFAEAYRAEGCRVAIADINLAAAEKAASGIGAVALHLDVTDQASIDACVAQAEQSMGGIDILINNAALFEAAEIVDITRASYDKLFAVNVGGCLFMTQAVAKGMIARGLGGRIINMASQAGRRGEALVAVYCATKAAVISLTQSAGLNLIKHGINVNAIAPGPTDTQATRTQAGDAAKDIVRNSLALKRMGSVDDMVGACLYLLSDDASWVTGQILAVDGGQTFRL